MEIKYIDITELTDREQSLLKAASETMKNAYNIYSGFYVGAAVMTTKSKIYTGACMENASYGLTLCAEVGAIQSAFSAGDYEIETIAITGGRFVESDDDIVSPCGRCRQLIFEASQVSGKNITIILANAKMTRIYKTNIQDLLPLPFGPADLGLTQRILPFRN